MKNNTVRIVGLASIVFVTGACMMMLEVLASRMLAPFVGTTITVWTSIIGVMLAGISLGYYVGGMVADRRKEVGVLALAILLAACASLIVLPLRGVVQNFHAIAGFDITYFYALRSLFATLFLFALPVFFLGIVSVYAIRLGVYGEETFGKINGVLYGVSTLGSTIGIILASFYFIPNFFVSHIVAGIAITLAVLALFVFWGRKLISE